jgi:transcriptional regulator with XRE-family HTH domain
MADAKTLLGERLRDLRKLRGLSQEDLAEQARISGKYLGEIDRGKANLTIDILEKLSTALRVGMMDLFDYQHEMGKKRLKEEINALICDAGDEDLRKIFRVLKSIMK